jgi:hypothetical protein
MDIAARSKLVRGVSNHGAAPSFETGAKRCSYCLKCMCLRPPQDEGDKTVGKHRIPAMDVVAQILTNRFSSTSPRCWKGGLR